MNLSVKSGRDDKVHIFIDSEYRLTVDAEYWYLSEYHLLKDIDEETYEKMESDIEKRRAFKKAASLSASRLHSKYEVYQKLTRNFSKEASEYAADKCEEIGLVNDWDFAEAYAKELQQRKGMGVSRIKLEMRRKGISSDVVEEVLESFECDETQQIKDLIERKYFRRLSEEKGRRSVFNALVRLGYSYGDAKRAIEEFLEENEI